MLADFEPAFAANYGLSLSTLAERYNAQETRDQSELMADMRELKERVSSVETNTSEQLLRTLGTFNEMQLAAYQAHAELRASLQRENARDQEAAATALRECAAQAEQAEQQIVSLTARLAEISADGEARATLAMAALQEESIKLAKVEQHAAELAARLSHSEEHVARLYASLSWRITRPARAAIRLARIPFSAPGKARAAAEHAKAQPQALLKRLVRRLASQPRARQLAMRVLVRFPALEQRVRALAYHTLQSPVGTPPQANAQQAPELTRAAQQILSQLQHHTHHDQSSEP
jgi:O-antigen chain-terminating methyltransferase